MRRREFIAGIGGAAAWPLVARAQQPKLPMVGLLNGVSFEGPYAVPVAAIRQGLQEAGFVEGQNLAIEYRTADGEYERLPELAADLVRGQAAVIVAIGASTLGTGSHGGRLDYSDCFCDGIGCRSKLVWSTASTGQKPT